MPIIRIDYDNELVDSSEIARLSQAVRDIVSEVTNIEDVFVYANSSEIKIKVAPIEVFIEFSASKVKDLDELMEEVKSRIQKWKGENDFKTLINLTIIPMPWKIEIGI